MNIHVKIWDSDFSDAMIAEIIDSAQAKYFECGELYTYLDEPIY